MLDHRCLRLLCQLTCLLLAACQAQEPAVTIEVNEVTVTTASTATPQTAATATVDAPTLTPWSATLTPVPTFLPPTPTRPTPTPIPPSPLPPEARAVDYSCPLDLAIISSEPRTSGVSVDVAFVAENGIQLWNEASNTSELLFEAPDVTSLAFSDDQELLAFTRRNEQYQTSLWILEVRDRHVRELLSAADLLALNLSQTKDLAVDPNRLVWIPGTHRLAFSTRTSSAGDAPPDVFREMRVIDADSRELVELLDHNRGGTFTFSPDGTFFALVSDTSVSLFRANGELVDKDIVTYPALGLTDFYYHPPISWSADSQFFTFAMINTTDGLEVAYDPNVTSTIWRIAIDGTPTELAAITGMTLDHAFSPDLLQVAFMRTSPKGLPLRELHIADVNNEWDVIYREGESLSFGQWNPGDESMQFIFHDSWGEAGIGHLCRVAEPLPSAADPGSTRLVFWVDAARYLYASHPGGEFYLGSVDGSQKLIGRMDPERVSGRTGPLKDYDTYWPSSAAADSGTEISTAVPPLPTLTPAGPLPGMIYEGDGGVCLVESSDAPADDTYTDGGHRKIADRWGLKISPDGTRGLEVVQVVHLGSPSWSPNGEQLAWIMGVVGGGYGRGGSWDIVLGVFDLEAGTVSLIHPYEPIGRGAWLQATWSTDGEWLAFSVETRYENLRGLWVTSADGHSKSHLSPLTHSPVIWSPQGD